MSERQPAVQAPESYATRPSLIGRLQASDPTGWERLIRLYKPLLWHWSRKNGIQPQDYEDVCQDVFKVVTVRIATFELGTHHGSFRAWLRAIVRNVCQERFRQYGVEGRAAGGTDAGAILHAVADPASEEDDPPELVNALYRRTIALVRGEFSDRDWQVFERLTFDNLAPAEVAQELGLTPVNVRAIKSRIYRRLREELGDIGEANSGPV